MRSSSVIFPLSVRCIVVLVLSLQLSFEVPSIDAATTIGGNETDHLALLEFKAKISHDPQNVTSSWNTSAHFCNWEGVICSRRHKRVTGLNLHSKELVGNLSPYIGNMSFLKVIRLQNNSLQGEIPPEIGRLFRIQVLDLSNNSFEGKIPANLSRCLNMSFLGLAYNKLFGNFPVELATLLKLKHIVIHANYLSGDIPSFLGNFSSLEALSARGNFFSGNIPQSLGQLKHLSSIGLGSNNLSGIVPQAIFNLSSITVLSLSNNSLHGSLPSEIGLLLPQLQILQISRNNFSGSVPVSLSNATKLQRILLQHNNFNGKVDVDFGGLQQLYRLFLSNNNLGKEGENDLDFITSLLNSSNLKDVDLSYNQFKGELPNSVSNVSSTLEWISVHFNQIGGRLPQWLSKIVSLENINLAYNQITGTIPIELGKLSRLVDFKLNDNRLYGSIPSSLGNISSLGEIRLLRNNLQGTIPSSLGNCQKLLFLSLSQNNLSGSIPKELFPFQSMLVSIALDQNRLDGSLPSEIGNLFNLKELYVSQNLLSGEIPNDLGRCNSLELLYMGNNNLEGSIPPSLASLKGLRILDLSHNNFSGKIPEYLEQFALEHVNLSSNNFDGEVPTEGVFANASAISVAGNNRLCGGIPELQLPRCPVSKRSKLRSFKIAVIIISCVFGVVVLLTCMWYGFKKKKREQSPTSLDIMSFHNVSYEMILKATDGFSSANLIGVGSFGSVYKGTFVEDGAIFAVKVLNLQQQGASKSFMAECQSLRNVRHRNLVKIITSCSSIDFQGNEFKALVYDYMPNGDLQDWLHTDLERPVELIDEQPSLSLLQRLNIAIDIGNGLDYLHHHCQKPIIHCDLKPCNILLDDEMVAHIGDFGLAKFLPHLMNPTQSSSIGVRGTIGYTPPEYGLGSEVSTSGDVYSYGILLLEMVTGKKPTDDIFVEGFNLHNFARMAMPNQVLKIVDPILLQEDFPTKARNDSKVECLTCLIKVGVACTMESPQDRMDVSNAIKELHAIKNNFMQTK
ncbi:putative receptor-like protein kinase At3g47110 isoform X2 [Manihot esculenta]|uniref:Uncharacterized protein n=2 Tax=Manihot esculenta TaxID=3983 RepID=A0ACB7HC36_MANES|nr:putative receptor-like protein kinase At3g47110 isoform X2 [Manihot esculenta]KAG8650248.1 hypothetical protein MANES_07G016700v8 [Manihot esculenta]KAG8650249.1 hypothetical protein MANES_07G016700v8 [Manihot esculenta]